MRKKVLIIEDQPRMSTLLRMYLERESYSVDIDDSGDAGLFHALIHQYDLIILNLLVKGMNSFNVIEELRAKKNTPVMIMSSVCGKKNESKCYGLGANEYILMPFSPHEMVNKVNRLLASNSLNHLNQPKVSVGNGSKKVRFMDSLYESCKIDVQSSIAPITSVPPATCVSRYVERLTS